LISGDMAILLKFDEKSYNKYEWNVIADVVE